MRKFFPCPSSPLTLYVIGVFFVYLSFLSFSSHFLFFVLVDEVTKNENRLHDFLYDVFCLEGKTGKTKMKNNKKKHTNY